jgi:hypothetical protein
MNDGTNPFLVLRMQTGRCSSRNAGRVQKALGIVAIGTLRTAFGSIPRSIGIPAGLVNLNGTSRWMQ